ncbi:MAG: hypothetical protein AAGD10_02110 [Myxococcota bacterium]
MFKKQIQTDCTVRIDHTFENLGAHVELDGVEAGPGDEVLVHGAPPCPPYGQTSTTRCQATLVRAWWWERLWTRMTGDLEAMELLDVSFTDGPVRSSTR